MVTAGLTSQGTLGSGEIGAIYNVSIQTQIDEINKERHMEMNLLEFMEAIAWCAEKVTSFPKRILNDEDIISTPWED